MNSTLVKIRAAIRAVDIGVREVVAVLSGVSLLVMKVLSTGFGISLEDFPAGLTKKDSFKNCNKYENW